MQAATPHGLEAGDAGGRVPGHQVGVGAEGPYADDRVGGVGVHVGGGSPVEVHPARGQPAAEFEGDGLGERHVVDGAQRVVAGERRTGAHLQAGDVAALFVDGDEDVVTFGPQLDCQRGELIG